MGSEDRLGVVEGSVYLGKKGKSWACSSQPGQQYPALPSLSWPLLQCEPQRQLPGVSQVGASLCFRASDKSEVAGKSHTQREIGGPKDPGTNPLLPQRSGGRQDSKRWGVGHQGGWRVSRTCE